MFGIQLWNALTTTVKGIDSEGNEAFEITKMGVAALCKGVPTVIWNNHQKDSAKVTAFLRQWADRIDEEVEDAWHDKRR